MPVESGLQKEEMPSPFQTLNRELLERNERLEELVRRVSIKLHKLSDTNLPQATCDTKESLPDLPFREGHLMEYYFRLNTYSGHLSNLLVQVEKLESLI
jgi:hypothetical protein